MVKKKKKVRRRPARRSKTDVNRAPTKPLEAVYPADVRLEAGKGSAGRGGGAGENYWHIFLDQTRVGYVYISLVDEEPFGKHASIQIHINQKHRARGIGSVAYGLACKESDHDEIYAKMRKANIGSQRAATRAGFEVLDDAEISQLAMRWVRPREME